MAEVINLPELPSFTGVAPIDERVSAPTVANVTLALAATEYSYAFPAGTKRFFAKNRENGSIQISYSVGTSGTNYATIDVGGYYTEENISPSVSLTLYFQSPSAAQLLEIISWA